MGEAGTPRAAAGGGAAGAAAAAAGPEGEAGGSKYVSRWQEVEELQCRLISIAPLDSYSLAADKAAAGCALGAAGPAVLRPGMNVLTFLASPVKRGVYVPKHIRGFLRGLPLHIDVHPPPSLLSSGSSPAQLSGDSGGAAPGGRGAAAALPLPTQRLPARSRASADGGGAALVFRPAPESFTSPAGRGGSEDAGWAAGWRELAAAADACHEDSVVMVVESASPRVRVWPAAAGGAVVAGQRQWLGLVLRPDRDQLRAATLGLTWPAAGGGAGCGGAGGGAAPTGGSSRRTISTGLAGSYGLYQHQHSQALGSSTPTPSPLKTPVHRASMSMGGLGDLPARLSSSSNLARLDAGGGASLAPVGPGAVALPLEPSAQQAQQEGAAPSNGSSEEAAVGEADQGLLLMGEEGAAGSGPGWLLGDVAEQQRFSLPSWAEQRPGCALWWWVEAGG